MLNSRTKSQQKLNQEEMQLEYHKDHNESTRNVHMIS